MFDNTNPLVYAVIIGLILFLSLFLIKESLKSSQSSMQQKRPTKTTIIRTYRPTDEIKDTKEPTTLSTYETDVRVPIYDSDDDEKDGSSSYKPIGLWKG